MYLYIAEKSTSSNFKGEVGQDQKANGDEGQLKHLKSEELEIHRKPADISWRAAIKHYVRRIKEGTDENNGED